MQEVQLYPRYMAHQLRPHLSAAIVGKLVSTNQKRHSIMLQTDSEAKMVVEGLLTQSDSLTSFESGRFYEMRGVCRSSRELEVSGWTCFGVDFDLNSYNQMLALATKEFKNIFYA